MSDPTPRHRVPNGCKLEFVRAIAGQRIDPAEKQAVLRRASRAVRRGGWRPRAEGLIGTGHRRTVDGFQSARRPAALAVRFHGGVQPLTSIAYDYEDDLGRAALEQLHALADSVNAMSVSSAAEIRTMTGGTYLLLHGAHDRRSGRAELVDNLIRFVVAGFPGSYGLVYEWGSSEKYVGNLRSRKVAKGVI